MSCRLMVLVLLCAPGPAFAVPAISGVSDTTPGHRQVVTITGSGFGGHADYNAGEDYLVAGWEDFEDGYLDDYWSINSPCGPRLETSPDRNRLNSSRSSEHTQWRADHTFTNVRGESCTDDAMRAFRLNPSTRQKVFMAGWYHWPVGGYDNFRYGGASSLCQSKFMMMSPDGSDNNKTYLVYGAGGCSWGTIALAREDGTLNSYDCDEHFKDREGEWTLFTIEVDVSKPAGQKIVNAYINGRRNWSKIYESIRDDSFGKFGFGTYARENPNGDDDHPSIQYWVDDAFVDYTWARVFISDQATYDDSVEHHQELQIPRVWESSSIQIEVNRGSFSDGESAFLYVVDENGEINGQGVPIVFAGSTQPPVCGDGGCGAGEDCASCPDDCLPAGTICCAGAAVLGDCCDDAECDLGICCDHACVAPPSCPSCDDGDACTLDSCRDEGTCGATCGHDPITACLDGDDCCPGGCDHERDSDCEGGIVVAELGDHPGSTLPGTVEDTFININHDVNVGDPWLRVYTYPAETPANVVLMQWDLSVLPADADITGAQLQLYMAGAEVGGRDDPYDVGVHPLLNVRPDLSQATGYSYDGTSPWTPHAACCHNGAPLAQADLGPAVDVVGVTMAEDWVSWDVTELARESHGAPATLLGLALSPTFLASSDSNRTFVSSDHEDAHLRPVLRVTYRVSPLGIVSTVLPDGVVGASYIAELEATGGEPPYEWTAIELPPGLFMVTTGRLSGTPEAAGTWDVHLTVSDAGSGSASISLPMVIRASECPSGLSSCGGVCVDVTADERHCGSCDHACPRSGACESGACVAQVAVEVSGCRAVAGGGAGLAAVWLLRRRCRPKLTR